MEKYSGLVWWRNLHPWHKMAVVLNYPNLKDRALARLLGLGLHGAIVGVRTRIKERAKLGKSLPNASEPQDVKGLAIPPDAPIDKTTDARPTLPKRIRKSVCIKSTVPAKPVHMEPVKKDIKCCGKNCPNVAVHKLAFCIVCASLFYKPMNQRVKELIAAAT